MSWQDRDYGREYGEGGWRGSLRTVLTGAAPLGRWFGIPVRVHAWFIFFALGFILFPPGVESYGYTFALKTALISMGILFGSVLLHEFGHCVAAKAVGGSADEIVLWPLGGLAYTNHPQRPWPSFAVSAAGPLVNLLICGACAGILIAGGHAATVPWNPLHSRFALPAGAAYYAWLVFFINYSLLLFNLLPIYPLDGGQMVQAALWPRMGYLRSMQVACVTGMVGAVIVGAFGLVSLNLLLVFLAISGFLVCRQKLEFLKEADGEEDFALLTPDDAPELEKPHRSKLSRRLIRKVRRRAAAEQAAQARLDAILAKVSSHGIKSLTWSERRALRKATEGLRERDRELEYTKDSP